MNIAKKLSILSLILIICFYLTLPISAHNFEAATASTNLSADSFDWKLYEGTLQNIHYDFRISTELEHEVDNIILYQLISDEIIPVDVLASDIYNVEVFSNFIDNNVTVSFVNPLQRAVTCCDDMRKAWTPTVALPTFNSNGWCIKHTEIEYYKCTNCGTIWNSRSTDYAGCGHYRYYGHGYQVCFLVRYT